MNLKKNKDINDFIIKLGGSISFRTNCMVELTVLSYINDIPIVIYDELNIPIYVFNKGLVYDRKINKETEIKKIIDNRDKNINIRFIYTMNNEIPDVMEILYFK